MRVTRRRSFSLWSVLVPALGVLVVLASVDLVYRNETAAELLRRIERAEAVLADHQRDEYYGRADDGAVEAFEQEVGRIESMDVFGWYPGIAELRDRYSAHAAAWKEYLRSGPGEEAVADIDRTWSLVCEALGSVVPYVDYGAVGRASFYVAGRGGCTAP